MTRRYGRSLRGRRLVAKVPHGRWRTLTFLAALRHDRIDAPCVIDGPINGLSFLAYVEQILLPTLSPGDIVVMDNLGSHKRQAIRRLIRTAGAKPAPAARAWCKGCHRWQRRANTRPLPWLAALLGRRHVNLAAAALATKMPEALGASNPRRNVHCCQTHPFGCSVRARHKQHEQLSLQG
jgi:DDE superfamily endonuclease